MKLSANFSVGMLAYSETAEREGIDNFPPAELMGNLKLLADGLEKVRSLLGHPLEISSGYRCPTLNLAVGGAPSSQHVQGLAADFVCPDFGSPLEIAREIGASSIEFDQCILEYGRWVHISFNATPRGRILTIYDARQGYLAGLWDDKGTRIA